MKVFISKYALSSGIFSVEADFLESKDSVKYRRDGGSFMEFAHKNEWHSCADKAIARAEEMRIAKLKSLDKQINKYSSMIFSVGVSR